MELGFAESEAVGRGFASEQEAFVPPLRPWQLQVHAVVPLTLLALVPAEHE